MKGLEEGVNVERQQVRGKWPINLERNVDQEFTGKDNTREKERGKMAMERRERKQDDIPPHPTPVLSQRKRFRREYK